MLPKLTGKKFYFHEVIGFQVEDEKHGNIGIITGVNDTTAQPLFEVEFGTVQMLIPMLDQFIVKVDREHKIMFLKTPEGLVDMYI
jgi:16S rRNA processing protein RimM